MQHAVDAILMTCAIGDQVLAMAHQTTQLAQPLWRGIGLGQIAGASQMGKSVHIDLIRFHRRFSDELYLLGMSQQHPFDMFAHQIVHEGPVEGCLHYRSSGPGNPFGKILSHVTVGQCTFIENIPTLIHQNHVRTSFMQIDSEVRLRHSAPPFRDC